MFSFFKSKSEASKFGQLILLGAYSEDLPKYADELYTEVSSSVRIDFIKFRNEYVFLRLFAADYSLALGAIHNRKVQRVRDAYTACIGEWANNFPEAPEIHSAVRERFDRYGQAVNICGRGSPFIAVAKTFLEFCNCIDHTKAGPGMLAVSSAFAIFAQAVAETMKSWGFWEREQHAQTQFRNLLSDRTLKRRQASN